MENQHKLIKGYRDLSQSEIDLMNDVKALGAQIEAVIQKVQSHLLDNHATNTYWAGMNAGSDKQEAAQAELHRIHQAEPQRWANIARTDFQTGLMALTRAVAQPGSF